MAGTDPSKRAREGPRSHGSSAPRVPHGVPEIARVVIDSADRTEVHAVAALRRAHRHDVRARVLLTPAGFVRVGYAGAWPTANAWSTVVPNDLRLLAASIGERVVESARRGARARFAHVVVGVDVGPPRSGIAAQFAVIVSAKRRTRVIAKSYPRSDEEWTLPREPDAATHLVRLDRRTTALVLVCHDMIAFSPRSRRATRNPIRWNAATALRGVARTCAHLVLHLAHTTDNAIVWRDPIGVVATLTKARAIATGIRYDEPHDDRERAAIQNSTRRGAVVDLVL